MPVLGFLLTSLMTVGAPSGPALDAGFPPIDTPLPADMAPLVDAGHPADAGALVDPADGGEPVVNESQVARVDTTLKGCNLTFINNRVLADEVYLTVLGLPTEYRCDEATAASINDRLEEFLHRSGYSLGVVNTKVLNEHQIEVDINEGRLEKIVFRGKLTLQTLRFKLALNVPQDVYNRPELERQIHELAQQLGLDKVWYELIPTREVKHLGPQVENLGEIEGYELVHKREPYELHIFFAEKEWNIGPGLDLRSSNIDGLEVIGSYQNVDLFLDGDRDRAAASGGMGLRRKIIGGDYYPTFSRAFGEAQYFAPTNPIVRPMLLGRAELVSRQRADLGLENYYNLYVDGLLNAQFEPARRQTITFGGGVRYQRVFGLLPATEDNGNPTQQYRLLLDQLGKPTSEWARPFAELKVNLLFDDGNDRWDRRHEFTAEGRQFFGLGYLPYGEAHLAWQKVFAWGWHDLWLKAHGAWLWGDVPFHNDEPVNGFHLRNVFANVYVHKVASESSEFRFSITRDIFKVSLFNDIAVFGQIDRTQLDQSGHFIESARIGDSFGAGFHALIEGMFQVDVYYALGLITARKDDPPDQQHFDNGFSVSIQKVF